MKILFYIIYPLFFFAMGCGIYVAFRDDEGLVDKNYYENGTSYFTEKADEEKLGIAISKPGTLKTGNNDIEINVTSHGKPLEHATLTLFIGNLSSNRYDSTLTMQEKSPGIYQATATILFKGVWFVRIDLQQQKLSASRKWFYDIKEREGRRTVTLNIEPKPVSAMKELTFSVTIKPCDSLPTALLLDLEMPEMAMGKNQVTLVRKSNCIWEGKGVVVRCMSHRTLWKATILSEELNNPAFTFNAR